MSLTAKAKGEFWGQIKSTNILIDMTNNDVGAVDWFTTNKFSLRDAMIGATQIYNKSYSDFDDYSDISPAVEFLRNHFTEKITIKDLADCVSLSVRQFERKFKKRFHEPFRTYIIKLRLYKACDLLINTNLSVVNIAMDTGFYDHSAFSKKFSSYLKITPLKFRKKYQSV